LQLLCGIDFLSGRVDIPQWNDLILYLAKCCGNKFLKIILIAGKIGYQPVAELPPECASDASLQSFDAERPARDASSRSDKPPPAEQAASPGFHIHGNVGEATRLRYPRIEAS